MLRYDQTTDIMHFKKLAILLLLLVISSQCDGQRSPNESALEVMRVGVSQEKFTAAAKSSGWQEEPAMEKGRPDGMLMYFAKFEHVSQPLVASVNFVDHKLTYFSLVEMRALMAPPGEKPSAVNHKLYGEVVQAVTNALGEPTVTSNADSTNLKTLWRVKDGYYIVSSDPHVGVSYVGSGGR